MLLRNMPEQTVDIGLVPILLEGERQCLSLGMTGPQSMLANVCFILISSPLSLL